MNRTIPCLLFLLGAVAPILSGCRSDPYRDEIDALARPYIDGEYIIGVSVGVLTPGGTYTYHYGATGRGGPPPNDDTLYEIGSITKTMTGLLLADGVTRGLYSLDTPVGDLLDGKAEVDPRITLRRLSIHTSGLPRVPSNLFPFDPRDPYATYTEERLLAYLKSPNMQNEPGAEASYSNIGVGLLGYALAESESTDYESLLSRRVLGPLGMDDTAIELNKEQQASLSGPHNADGEPAHPWSIVTLAGAGGVRSTVPDMLAYARAQIDPDRTLLAEAIRLGQAVQNREGEAGLDNPMGLGWFIGEGGVLQHGGQTGGYKSLIFIAPSKGSAVVVLANTANTYVESFAEKLRDRVLEGKPIEPPELQTPVQVSESLLADYAGRYLLIGAGFFEVTHEAGRLYAQLTNQPRFRLYPEDDDTFRYRVVEATIDFERDESGQVVRLVLHQNGRDHICPRVPEEEGESEAE